MPELEFLNGVVGYLRAIQTADEVPDREKLDLASIVESTGNVFSRYADATESKSSFAVRAAAQRLWGVMLARLAEKHGATGESELEVADWKQAREHFAEAVSHAPENTAARNLHALSQLALCCKVSGGLDVNEAIGGLRDVLSLRPNDMEALNNLKAAYAYLAHDQAAPPAARRDASVRSVQVSEVIRLLLDP